MFLKSLGESISEVSHKLIERPKQSVYYNHIHNNCEILLFIRGKADYNIDGQIFSPAPYDLLFIPAATYHYLIPTESSPYENYVIGIDPSILDKKHYDKLFSPPLMINIQEDDTLKGFFTRLDFYSEVCSDKDFAQAAYSLIRELVIYCSYRKDSLNHVHSGSLVHIDKIIQYVSENIEKPLDADTVANHFSFSKSYVQNIFSQSMHIGLKKYIMQKKIFAAHADIERGMSPGEACEKYCFGDYSVFYRLYKKTFAASPSERKD